jgi:catechol 2,3-dioxygenase-like lactoylglutathione lyase family enzyme
MDMQDAAQLAGIHHVKPPVTDLARSREWYQTRLGYRVQIEFVEQGQLMGYALEHPNGGRCSACGSTRNEPGRRRALTTRHRRARQGNDGAARCPADGAGRAARRGALGQHRLDPAPPARPGTSACRRS